MEPPITTPPPTSFVAPEPKKEHELRKLFFKLLGHGYIATIIAGLTVIPTWPVWAIAGYGSSVANNLGASLPYFAIGFCCLLIPSNMYMKWRAGRLSIEPLSVSTLWIAIALMIGAFLVGFGLILGIIGGILTSASNPSLFSNSSGGTTLLTQVITWIGMGIFIPACFALVWAIIVRHKDKQLIARHH